MLEPLGWTQRHLVRARGTFGSDIREISRERLYMAEMVHLFRTLRLDNAATEILDLSYCAIMYTFSVLAVVNNRKFWAHELDLEKRRRTVYMAGGVAVCEV